MNLSCGSSTIVVVAIWLALSLLSHAKRVDFVYNEGSPPQLLKEAVDVNPGDTSEKKIACLVVCVDQANAVQSANRHPCGPHASGSHSRGRRRYQHSAVRQLLRHNQCDQSMASPLLAGCVLAR
jgi:hypothetical protein